MSALSDGQIKAAFFQLVKAAGGVEAAGAVVGVSHQRVSQLQSLNHADMPTLRQVRDLEAFVGLPIVTAAMSASIETGDAGKSPLEEASEVTEAAAELQSAVRRGASEREVSTAITKLRREIEDVPVALEARGKKSAGLQH